jgi:hypothetical protein
VKQSVRSRRVYYTVASSHRFCEAQTKKSSRWFWDPNHQNVAAGFKTQTRKPSTTLVLRSNWEKLLPLVLRANWRKPSQWFWCQTNDKPSTLDLRLNQETRVPRLHMHITDRTQRHPTSWSPGHRVPDLCDYPWSSTPGLLLLPRSSSLHDMPHLPPAHHETSKRDSPNQTKIKVKQTNHPRFEFKPRQVNDSSQSNQGIDNLVSQRECG